VLIKAHPGIRSAIHTDKSEIDRRYVTTLFHDYGLDYAKLLDSDPSVLQHSLTDSRICAPHPELSLKEIGKKFSCLVVSHHGSIIIEACHLCMPAVKYRFCKNRFFDYCHDWANKGEYKMLLKYFSSHRSLPSRYFRDTYLDVAVSLASKSLKPDYNTLVSNVYSQYAGEPPFTSLKNRADIFRQVARIDLLYREDPVFAGLISSALSPLFPK